jgi:hypothetical protein
MSTILPNGIKVRPVDREHSDEIARCLRFGKPVAVNGKVLWHPLPGLCPTRRSLPEFVISLPIRIWRKLRHGHSFGHPLIRFPPPRPDPDWSDLVVGHVYGRGWIFKGTPEGDAWERRNLMRLLAEGTVAASGRHTCDTDNWRTRDRFRYEPGTPWHWPAPDLPDAPATS